MAQIVHLTAAMGEMQEHTKKINTSTNPRASNTDRSIEAKSSTTSVDSPTRIQVKNMMLITVTEWEGETIAVNDS